MNGEDDAKFGLAETVAALRQELADAQRSGEGRDLRFRVTGVELEASVEISRSVDAKGGLKFFVVEAGVGGRVADTAVQKIRLTLTPPEGFLIGRPAEGQ